MSARSEFERPVRRYNPSPADIPLERVRSASTIVVAPGLIMQPFSLAALLADTDSPARDRSSPVRTQTAGPVESSVTTSDVVLGLTEAPGGGSRSDTLVAGPSQALSSAVTISFATVAADDGTGSLLAPWHPKPGNSGGGAQLGGRGSGALPSRGSAAAVARPAPSLPGASGLMTAATATGVGTSTSPLSVSVGPLPNAAMGGQAQPGPGAVPAASRGTGAPVPAGPSRPAGPTTVPGTGTHAAPSAFATSDSTDTATGSGSGHAISSPAAGTAWQAGSTTPIVWHNPMEPVFAQPWNYQKRAPWEGPYYSNAPRRAASGVSLDNGPGDFSTDGDPFLTRDALIRSYINSALADFVPTDTGGSDVSKPLPTMNVSGFDGIGSYTFSAGGVEVLEGQSVSGGLSTADHVSFSYSFIEAGSPSRGYRFNLLDSGGASFGMQGGNAGTSMQVLTEALSGSDSYSFHQSLNEDDRTGTMSLSLTTDGSYSGQDTFALQATQTLSLDSGGTVTMSSYQPSYTYGGSYTYDSTLQSRSGYSPSSFASNDKSFTSSSQDSGSYALDATGNETVTEVPAGGTTYYCMSSESDSFRWQKDDTGSHDKEEEDKEYHHGDGYQRDYDDKYKDHDSYEHHEKEEGYAKKDYSYGGYGYQAIGPEVSPSPITPSYQFGEKVSYAATSDDSSQDSQSDSVAASDAVSTFTDTHISTMSLSDHGSGQVDWTVTGAGSQVVNDGTITGGSGTFNMIEEASATDDETDRGTDNENEEEDDAESQPQSAAMATAMTGTARHKYVTITKASRSTDTYSSSSHATLNASGTDSVGMHGLPSGGSLQATMSMDDSNSESLSGNQQGQQFAQGSGTGNQQGLQLAGSTAGPHQWQQFAPTPSSTPWGQPFAGSPTGAPQWQQFAPSPSSTPLGQHFAHGSTGAQQVQHFAVSATNSGSLANPSTAQETESDTFTDDRSVTESDTLRDQEVMNLTFGAGGNVVTGRVSIAQTDSGSVAETDTDIQQDTVTHAHSHRNDGIPDESDTSTGQDTLTDGFHQAGSSSDAFTSNDQVDLVLGLSGLVAGGNLGHSQSDNMAGRWDNSDAGQDAATAGVNDSVYNPQDGSSLTEDTNDTDSFTDSGPTTEQATFYESMSETIGPDGLVVGGGMTRSLYEVQTDSLTVAVNGTHGESFTDDKSDAYIAQNESGSDSGNFAITAIETMPHTLIMTETDILGPDGAVVGGQVGVSFAASLSETVSDDYRPTGSLSDSNMAGVTMTLAGTHRETETSTSSIQGSATETLGFDGEITGGSAAFTLNEFKDTRHTDTARSPSGDTTITASGSDSVSASRTESDILGVGGTIASGTRNFASHLSHSAAQTISHDYGWGMTGLNVIKDSSDFQETGTETLGQEGTVAGGSDTYSRSEARTIGEQTTSSLLGLLSGITQTTETFGFSESGSEAIGAGDTVNGSGTYDWIDTKSNASGTGVLGLLTLGLGTTETLGSGSGTETITSGTPEDDPLPPTFAIPRGTHGSRWGAPGPRP